MSASSTAEEHREAAPQVSNEALAKLAPRVQWVHSYFAGDMTYWVYLAEDPEDIRQARRAQRLSGQQDHPDQGGGRSGHG